MCVSVCFPSSFHLVFSCGQHSPPPFYLIGGFAQHFLSMWWDIHTEYARPPHRLLLAALAAAGKDVSFSAGVLSLSHSTRAHDELAWRIKHHRLGLQQFSWAVRNRVK